MIFKWFKIKAEQKLMRRNNAYKSRAYPVNQVALLCLNSDCQTICTWNRLQLSLGTGGILAPNAL